MGAKPAWKCHPSREKYRFAVSHHMSQRKEQIYKDLLTQKQHKFCLIYLGSQKSCEFLSVETINKSACYKLYFTYLLLMLNPV